MALLEVILSFTALAGTTDSATVAANLDARTTVLQSRDVRFDITEYSSKHGTPPEDLERVTPTIRAEWVALFEGQKYLVGRRFTEASEKTRRLLETRNTFVFDGVTAKALSIVPDTRDPVQGGISSVPNTLFQRHHAILWLNFGCAGIGSDGLDEMLGHVHGVQVENHGAGTSIHLRDPLMSQFEWDFFCTEWDSRVRVGSIVRSFRENPTNPIRFTETFAFDDWRDVDGVEIPFHCQVITHYPRGMEGTGTEADSIWGATDMRMIEVGPKIEPTPEMFDLTFEDGTAIHDERYRITYTLGGTRLMIDGRPFITTEPLTGEVGENLEYWLTKGEFEQVVNVSTLQSPSRQWPWLMIGGIAAAGGIVFWPALRRGGRRFSRAA